MSSIKSLEMAEAVAIHPNITMKSTFFGLSKTAVYNPTQSKLRAERLDYAAEDGERLKRLLALPLDQVAKAAGNTGTVAKAVAGPYRLEVAYSEDHRFLAVQQFGYSGFDYKPLTDVTFYEGNNADALSNVIL